MSSLQSWEWSVARRRLVGAGVVATVMAFYYAIFFFPPRLVGLNDPDRFYHLGLSRLISTHGLLRTLPQMEDLGWGRYFPDKEFLFHVLTGVADRLGGSNAVLMLVPLIGVAISVSLYVELSRVIRPWQAAILATTVPLLTADYIFRLTILRPHMLAILFFCLLLSGILRGRPLLAALAAAGFALGYHAFYIVVLVASMAAVFTWPRDNNGRRTSMWAIAGLVVGIIVNPYFPSNLVMSLVHLQIALGVNAPPGAEVGVEIQPIGLIPFLLAFGFVPFALASAAAVIGIRRLKPNPQNAEIWFLFVLTLALLIVGLRSVRAMEYGVPAAVLLAGYCIRAVDWGWWIPLNVATLVLAQGYTAWIYYQDIWSNPQEGSTGWYFAAIASLPPGQGGKVFNCQWDSSAYLLYLRPDLRFVDGLDPALLWVAAPAKYVARQELLAGYFADPHTVLRTVFDANYVLCASPALIRQMDADQVHFRPIAPQGPVGPLRIYSVR